VPARGRTRLLVLLATAGCAVVAFVPAAQSYTAWPDPLAADACTTYVCTLGKVAGDGASIDDYGFTSSGAGEGYGSTIADWVSGGMVDAEAVAAEAELATGPEQAAVLMGLLADPVTLPLLGGAAIAIGAVAVAKHFHVGSAIASMFETQTLDVAFVSAAAGASLVTVSAYQTNMKTACNSNYPALSGFCIGANIGGSTVYSMPQAIAGAGVGCLGSGNPTATQVGAYQYVNGLAAAVGTSLQIGAMYCSVYPYAVNWLTVAQYESVWHPTIAPWTGQTVDATYGNPNAATGAGIQPKPGAVAVAPPTTLSAQPAQPYCTNTGALKCPGDPLSKIGTHGKEALRCHAHPSRYSCPTTGGGVWTGSGGLKTSSYVVPGCEGMTVDECEALLNTLTIKHGWSAPAFTEITAPVTAANPVYPAGAVISTSPGGGATVSTSTDFDITVNPSTLPVIIPFPLPWETGTQYAGRLTRLGVPSSITIETLTATPLTVGPGEVDPSGITPQTGTTVDPTTTTVTVPVGNSAAPYPPGDPTAPPIGGGLPSSGCNCPGLDLTPLTSLSVGGKFPFGIFAYAAAMIGQFDVTAHAPDFNIATAAPSGYTVSHYDVNLGDPTRMGWLDTYMGYWRTLLSIVLWVGAIWLVGSRFLGIETGDPGGATDELL
jgi:hypothetical protein